MILNNVDTDNIKMHFYGMDRYHHGNLKSELLRLGAEALETESWDRISLRSLAEGLGVSKTAPYRHFKDKESFLAALADEGFRILCASLENLAKEGPDDVGAMGRAYMDFALRHPALYRLMMSPISCKIPQDPVPWARKALLLLGEALVRHQKRATGKAGGVQEGMDMDAVTAAWGYIHGITLIRIDGIFPADLPAPDWSRLESAFPDLSSSDFPNRTPD